MFFWAPGYRGGPTFSEKKMFRQSLSPRSSHFLFRKNRETLYSLYRENRERDSGNSNQERREGPGAPERLFPGDFPNENLYDCIKKTILGGFKTTKN